MKRIGDRLSLRKLFFLLGMSLWLAACQQATPPVPEVSGFERIASYWGAPILSIYDGAGKNPKLYFSVIAQADELKQILSKVEAPEKFQNVDLSKDLLIMAEWGLYFSAGIRVEISEVKITQNQAEIGVNTFLPDPASAQAAVFSSAFEFITIPRTNFDPKTPAKFVFIHQGTVISTQSIMVK